MPQIFLRECAGGREALFGVEKRYDGRYTISYGIGGPMSVFDVDRDQLINMRELFNEALDEKPVAEPAPKPETEYATKNDFERIQAQLIRLAHKLGLDNFEVCTTLHVSKQKVHDVMYPKMRPRNPPKGD